MKKKKRKSNRLVLLFGIVVLAGAAAAAYFVTREKPGPPSFLFILIDTLRSDHLGCLGYQRETTPNIDRLASGGVLFKNATSQSSWTLPSMISLMSGRHIFSKLHKLPDDVPSLPQMMKKRGFQTAGFVANSLVGEKEGFAKGFDHFEIREHNTPQWSCKMLNRRLLPWMRTSLKPPFFLYVHYLDPHFPYEPPPEFAVFDKKYDPIHRSKRRRFTEFVKKHPELAEHAIDDIREMRRQIDLYDGEVRFVDKAVEDVLSTLEKTGLSDETVVIITSDHGECLWDHEHYPRAVEKRHKEEERNLTTFFFRDHSYHLFEELISVPLIFSGPGIQKNLVIETAVENVDIIPTILALSGEATPFNGDGRSLDELLRGKVGTLPENDAVFSFCNMAACAKQPTRNLKIVSPSNTGKVFGLSDTVFDLNTDPGETENKVAEFHEAASPLFLLLNNKKSNDFFKNSEGDMDEDTKTKMKELGYIK